MTEALRQFSVIEGNFTPSREGIVVETRLGALQCLSCGYLYTGVKIVTIQQNGQQGVISDVQANCCADPILSPLRTMI